MAAEYLDEPAAECIVVEDAYAGIQAARAAGMKAAGIGDAAECPWADYSLSGLEDLLTLEL